MAALFSELDVRARRFWAKSGEAAGHGVLAHMLDVAAVAEVLLEREPERSRQWAAQAFGLPEAEAVRWLAALVGLHDFGKAIPGFQSKWPQGQLDDEAVGLSFSERSQSVTDHARASAALLWGHLPRLGLELMWVWGVLQAISAHHGYNFDIPEMQRAKPPFEAPEWAAARQCLFEAYWNALAPQGLPDAVGLSTPAVEWLAGLTSVADWIGSNPVWFPLQERSDSLVEHFERAKGLAGEALAAIGWSSHSPLLNEPDSTDRLIGRIVRREGAVSARPLQQYGDRLLEGVQGPALLLVEAPMGEGKTELAFLAHLRLQAANRHRGLYVALPTQATGNALFGRALTFLGAFAGDVPLDVQLVHGGAGFDERVQHLHDIHGAPGESVASSTWFSQRRRPLLSPYGVGTIDQALFATLNVKHHFVRLWGLSNRVVVLDEVHAYDTYTSGLIEALLRWLKALGSSVVLMSATLPAQRRMALLRAWGVAPEAVPDLSYPRLLLADDAGLRGATFASRRLPPIHLEPLAEDEESLAACAAGQVAAGGCGALIVNTVDRAQRIYRLLRERLDGAVELHLFHARFPADQRAERERAVLERFGPGCSRPQRALLVATQVAEQSLDVDFDFMLTDLAPVDLILQRAGRLHRHERTRPAAHEEARLFVAGLLPERLPELTATAWEFVYEPYILGRTWALLSREAVLQLPDDIDRLVQAVYDDDELPADLDEQARGYIEGEALGQHFARRTQERQQSLNIALDPAEEPQNAYVCKPRGSEEGEGLGLTNRTRLGDDAIGLVPVHVTEGGWAITADGPVFDLERPMPDGWAKLLFARQLRLSRAAVVKHFQGIQAPAAFAEHPLLRHLKPLPLTDKRYVIGSLTVRLDEEQGVLYEKDSSPRTEDL